MSKTKFNGFEKWFITTAIEHAVEEAEIDLDESLKSGRRPIYTKGYFTMVGNDLIAKVHSMTLKKDQ
jgi:hypothetical protein